MPEVGISIWPGTPALAAIRLARHAERLGYHSVWVTESTAAPSRDGISLLGAMAALTERILLATGVINIYTRSPLLIASTVATLDELSGMRFLLGLGTGHDFSIERWHSLRFEKPLTRMREYIRCIRLLLSGERVDFQGKTIALKGARLAQKPPRDSVPIYGAGVGEKMVKAVSEVADGLLLTFNPLERLGRVIEWVRDVTRRRGRTIHVASYLVSFVARDPEVALGSARRVVAAYCAAPFYNKLFVEMGYPREAESIARLWWEGDAKAAAAQVSEAMARRFVIIGGEEELLKALEDYVKAGIDLPILAPYYIEGEEDHVKELLGSISAHMGLAG